MTIKEVKGIKDCSLLAKIMMDAFNLYAFLQEKGKDRFFHCFFLKDWSQYEIDIIFSFILDSDGLPFSDPIKRENITMKEYLTGLRMLSDYFCDVDLPSFIYDEVGYLSLDQIERATNRFIAWREERQNDFGEFLIEALKTYRG